MKARAASPDVLVDLNGLDDLKGIELGADGTLDDRRDGDLHRDPRLGGGARPPDPRRGLRDDRRRPGAEPRHDRRQRLLERPDEPPAAAHGGGRRADDDRAARAASARSPRTSSSSASTSPRSAPGELLTRITVPAGKQRRLRRGHARRRRHVHRERGGEHRTASLRVALGCVDAVPGRRRSPRRPTRTPSERPCAAPASTPPADVHASSEYRPTSPRCSRCAPPTRRRRGAEMTRDRVLEGGDRHRQRRRVRARGRGAQAPDPLRPRRPRPDRQPHRLRHRQLRRVLDARRRPAREELHAARRPGRRRDDRDGRGARRRTAS